jgi:hypothetical protein
MIRLLSFVGKETHGGDAALLLHVLQWNFGGENYLGYLCIGVDPQTSPFTLESCIHNREENGWNKVNFNNLVCCFGCSCEVIDEKIKEFKKQRAEAKGLVRRASSLATNSEKKSELSCDQLRKEERALLRPTPKSEAVQVWPGKRGRKMGQRQSKSVPLLVLSKVLQSRAPIGKPHA